MVRKTVCMAVCAAAVALTGCVGVIGNRVVTMPRELASRRAVQIDGQLYIVDVGTGNVMRVDPLAVEQAGPFTPVPVPDEDDD